MALAQPTPSPRIDPALRPSAFPLFSHVSDGPGRLKRCTFRRITVAEAGPVRRQPLPVYDVACLYPSRESFIPLGDLDSARAICDACAATGIFRPDED